MPDLMPTVDSMSEVQQEIVKAMSDAARDVMREHGYQPLNDDRRAVFDEACAVYLRESEAERRKRIGL